MQNINIKLIERFANLFELLGIVFILILALLFQFYTHELPCPLCLLQRVGFFGITFGFLLNLRFGFRPSHYSIVILSGLFTCFVALRQIAMHVVPGTGAYGTPIFGLHLYTWSFLIAMAIVVVTTLLLGITSPYMRENNKRWRLIRKFLFAFVTVVIAINLVAVILQCGFKPCPGNPVGYELLERRA